MINILQILLGAAIGWNFVDLLRDNHEVGAVVMLLLWFLYMTALWIKP